jgi:predicted lactoylglutathione lyase
MDLGENFPCLSVKDLAKSMDFYRQLEFAVLEDHSDEQWAVLQHNNMLLCLYEAHIDENLINFRGGDVADIAKTLRARGVALERDAELHEDGSWSAELRDPDGNSIFFNTFPDERDTYERNGTLIDYKPGGSR